MLGGSTQLRPHGYDHSVADELEIRVRQFVAEILTLRLDEVQLDDDLLALGGASLAVIELSRKVHAEYGVDLSLDSIFEATNIREIVSGIRAEAPNIAAH